MYNSLPSDGHMPGEQPSEYESSENQITVETPKVTKRPWYQAKITEGQDWDAASLAEAAQCIWKAISKKKQIKPQGYAFVYDPHAKTFRLHINSAAWYEHFVMNNRLPEKTATIKAYIEEMTESAKRAEQDVKPDDESEFGKYEGVKKVCHNTECKKDCGKSHLDIRDTQCQVQVRTRSGQPKLCEHFVRHLVRLRHCNPSTGHFDVGLRNEPRRTVVVSPVTHCSNEDAVQNRFFWKVVLKCLSGCRGDSVSFHGGSWESAQHQDSDRLECHAHAHIAIGKAVWAEEVVSAARNDKFNKHAQQYWMAAENYAEKDLQELVQFLQDQEDEPEKFLLKFLQDLIDKEQQERGLKRSAGETEETEEMQPANTKKGKTKGEFSLQDQ
ncbi:hypothetical protein DFS34DRAFT_2900 [Phlyctochytrium arcticum]|nr:hypothetical protein DFS34DRAFT_2900 [Phlyctochytrium arcticum]